MAWTVAYDLHFPGLLLLLQLDPSDSDSVSTPEPALHIHVTFQKKKNVTQLTVPFLCWLPLKLLHFRHRVYFCSVQSVSAADLLSQQFFTSMGQRQLSLPGSLLPSCVSCLVEVGLEEQEVCCLGAKPVWQPTYELGTRHECCVWECVYAKMGIHRILYA